METKILEHYRRFGACTNPGLYEDILRRDLPEDVKEIGRLVRASLIHRTTLAQGNTGTNVDLKYGDMTTVPWYRQAEDDFFVTAAAMLAELYRRDARGFVLDRHPADKLILTCRYVAVLMASILKSKGIPARVRSGNAAYFGNADGADATSGDHWINQWWDVSRDRWVTMDVDGIDHLTGFDLCDIPEGRFDFPAPTWLGIRAGDIAPQRFTYANGARGEIVVLWALFYDFHCLMNNEVKYFHVPAYGKPKRFAQLSAEELARIDYLARLMLNPDTNFDALCDLWETSREFRMLTGGLL